jgi:hypothetical protein
VETVNYTLEGRKIDVILHISVPESKGTPDFSNVMVYPKDITEGKVIQDELRILSVLPEANPDIVVIMQCENKVIPTLPKKM